MPKILTAREVEALLRAGEAVPADARLTPSARDLVEDRRRNGRTFTANAPRAGSAAPATKPAASSATPPAPSTPDYEFRWAPGSDPKTPSDIQRFFTSPAIEELKVRICDIGRRLWEREYTDGNGGNITIRVGDNLALCTPTLICKGFMKPADICLVDLDGNQLAGTRKRTSEAMTHFGIMKRQPAAKSCVHAHPPHATAFAIANAEIPTCLIPEAEVFLGKIALAKYQTPGTPENADEVGQLGIDHQAILMQNHGVIVWGKDVEDAYWKMENIDSYCKTVAIAGGLGSGLHRFGTDKLKDLIGLRKALGMPDPRAELEECELCSDNSEFRPGAVCQATPPSSAAPATAEVDPQVETLVQSLTNEILRQLATAK
ncbi:class II aldolase/adducin family protein [Actomonas aquatica]|uniref:Class II aldolase/adducin family protein n=1 Tax=Actomonas aquatica TaxID=2866162 RepID=A0ABZ1C7F0_9BACT|nr:class II aldolase/adducin family protein [Opitutus sp. WL0086]WRQ87643.1 class II aldolase/adducin family protein [Opitutus sp. WL0086]